ncbi:unnamed protein product [Toxocara canis]|uniref:DUF4817 domain-containing protein n=1 Tax=Toxocara canis TaxID=6265 RepID=A0A183UDP6_TOXCA|nr:unnamed protein product [Toxocara canis]
MVQLTATTPSKFSGFPRWKKHAKARGKTLNEEVISLEANEQRAPDLGCGIESPAPVFNNSLLRAAVLPVLPGKRMDTHLFVITAVYMHLIQVGLRNVQSAIADFRSVQELNAYFEKFFARNQSISAKQWFSALPTPIERLQMKKLIKEVFSAKDYETHCSPSLLDNYDALRGSITVTLFKRDFCVIHELVPSNNGSLFKRFWGYVVISNRPERPVHHSAAHFESDGDVCNEAAAVFERTAGKSLVVAGANRFAVVGQETNSCQPTTALADAAHNNETMFHIMNEAIYEAASSEPRINNTFIQWHGMAETSCSITQAYVSAGVNNASRVYYNGDLAANRNIRGAFVHIEQKQAVRDNWDLWTKVINASFPAPSHGTSHAPPAILAVIVFAMTTSPYCMRF